MTSLAHVRFKVDARERDEIVCLGEILMQVKKTRKSYIDLYTSSYIMIVDVDCQKTANSRLTFPGKMRVPLH